MYGFKCIDLFQLDLFFSHYIDISFTHGRDTDTIKFEKGNGREQCQIIFQFVL